MQNKSNPNLSQSKAIIHNKGPMLVIAGPGSGKTFTITQRILYLINEYKVPPQNILVITFTKAAAKEMQQRFANALDGKMLPVSFGTFHAIFFSILKNSYPLSASSILRESQKRDILTKILQKLELYDGPDMIDKMILEISRCKNLGIMPSQNSVSICEMSEFEEICHQYQKQIEKLGKIDFDDMIVRCYELLTNHPAILKRWQDIYQYILIDEFQDINPMQYEIIKLLSKPRNNLFVVGDDDQSIYSFRGASPQIMLSFFDDYPDAKKVTLDTNYRSRQDIVETANRLIVHNENRYHKEIHAINTQTNGVRLFCFDSRSEQAQNIVKLIKQYMQQKDVNYSDIAIIYRTSAHCVLAAEKMVKAGIPFFLSEKPKHIYDSPVGKDIISYIKLALEIGTNGDFYRVINKPVRYVKREMIPRDDITKEKLLHLAGKEEYVIHNIIMFYNSLKFLKTMSPFAAINYIRKGIGYETYILNHCDKTKEEMKETLDLLNQLQDSAKEFTTLKEWLSFIETYDEEMKKESKKQWDMDAVTIATMHATKGLEWPVVIIPDLNEKFIPHKKAFSKEEIEEERRMLYVALTRAKKHLFLFTVANEKDIQSLPSRFLYEMFEQLKIV